MMESKVLVEENVLHHNDCRNFCALDVAKGLCRRTENIILIDSDTCKCFEQLPKCKFCENYEMTDPSMGICKAGPEGTWAYPEMIAVTCEMFKARG